MLRLIDLSRACLSLRVSAAGYCLRLLRVALYLFPCFFLSVFPSFLPLGLAPFSLNQRRVSAACALQAGYRRPVSITPDSSIVCFSPILMRRGRDGHLEKRSIPCTILLGHIMYSTFTNIHHIYLAYSYRTVSCGRREGRGGGCAKGCRDKKCF